MSSIIFGPITSRRFGTSLGIDLSPNQKQCNFDCLYCELKGAKTVSRAKDTPSYEEIIKELQKALDVHQNCDVMTLTANGEPTLYPQLQELVEGIIALKRREKLLILSNGSTIADAKVQAILSRIDIVKLSLDCVTQACFKKLDRPYHGLNIEDIIEGMCQFRQHYTGELVIEILVVKDLNDSHEEFLALKEVLKRIAPNRIDVGTIDRPPAYAVQGVDMPKLEELASLLEGLHVTIAYTKNYAREKHSLSENEIFEMMERRPQSFEDVEHTFDEQSLENLEQLLKKQLLHVKKVAGVNFYTTH